MRNLLLAAAAGGEMPRYFFHVYSEQPEIDYEGEELSDKYAAWKEATVTAGQIMQDMDGKLQPGRGAKGSHR
jgi:hypothetical protein